MAVAAATDGSRSASADHDRAPSGRFLRRLALLTVLGVGLQAWFVLDNWNRKIYDAAEYSNNGKVIEAGYGFVEHSTMWFHGIVRQTGIHAPLTSVWHALVATTGGKGIWPYQVGLLPWGALVVVAVGLLGRRVAGDRVGLLAAGLAALHPGVWSYPATAMSETPSQVLLALLLLAAYRYRARPTQLAIGAVALVAALAGLARSELLLAGAMVLVAILVATPGLTATMRRRHVVVALAWGGALALPWIAYNQVRFDPPAIWSTGFEVALVSSSCADAREGLTAGYWALSCRPAVEEVDRTGNPVDEAAIAATYRAVALERLRADRAELPGVLGQRLARTFAVGTDPSGRAWVEGTLEGRGRPAVLASILAFYATLPLAAAGWVVLRRRGQVAWLLVLPALAPALLTTMATHGSTRYRMGVDLGLIVLAAVAIDAGIRRGVRVPRGPDGERVAAL